MTATWKCLSTICEADAVGDLLFMNVNGARFRFGLCKEHAEVPVAMIKQAIKKLIERGERP